MLILGLLVLSATAAASLCPVDPTFPPWFQLGASSSSYQVEGAWNISDKGESIWDTFTHTPGAIPENATGDVACDSYNLWQRDIEMAVEMGLDSYRFSISWPRLLPKGFDYYVSKDGAEYYNNLINGLLERGIEPIVTLYHWDLPKILQRLDGWTNPLISDWFANYARVVFSLYGDRVKTWITINEPIVMCDGIYTVGVVTSPIVDQTSAVFICSKNVLLGHSKAWRVYDEEFRHIYHGRVSVSNNLVWFEPKSPEDQELTDLTFQYINGRYAHPIYSEAGGWPPALEEFMAAYSARQGYPHSLLPAFTKYEKALIRGTYDFLGLNYYTGKVVRPALAGEVVVNFFITGIPLLNVVMESPPNTTSGFAAELPVYPEGLRKILCWIKSTYGDLEIVITENGFSTSGSDLDNDERINFIRSHLEQILLAMKLDFVNVTGYIYWSLMDSFEWTSGYMAKFGLYEVNFTDPLRTRTPRSAAYYYSDIIKNRQLL